MNRRWLVGLVGLLGLWLLAGSAHAEPPPNIVILLADDLGWNDVGYHGSEITTPTIDRLADEGVKLERFYAAPLCSVARASLMTGRHPFRYGLQGGIVKEWSTHGLAQSERTLADALQSAGYTTHLLGKWHLGLTEAAQRPLQRGFAHHYGSYGGSLDYFTHRKFGALDWHRDERAIDEPGYATELIGREAVRVIGAHDTRAPLFLLVSFNAPHRPLQVPKADLARFAHIRAQKRRTYAAMVASMDDQIGHIVTALEARGLRERTLIVFASDNGATPLAGGSNHPLRGLKGGLYEGGIRTPALVNWPGTLQGQRAIETPIHLNDLYPTLLGLAGAPAEQPLPLDGRDVWPMLARGAPSPHGEELLLYLWPAGAALLQGDYKLVLSRRSKQAAFKTELFDLAADPREAHDLSAAQPERVASMTARVDHYRAQAVPALENVPRMPKGYPVPEVWGASEADMARGAASSRAAPESAAD